MMTPFLLYLLRASLYLAIFYAFYLLVMRRTTLFRFNRIALLLGTVLCHLLPLLRLRVKRWKPSVSPPGLPRPRFPGLWQSMPPVCWPYWRSAWYLPPGPSA